MFTINAPFSCPSGHTCHFFSVRLFFLSATGSLDNFQLVPVERLLITISKINDIRELATSAIARIGPYSFPASAERQGYTHSSSRDKRLQQLVLPVLIFDLLLFVKIVHVTPPVHSGRTTP